MQIAGAGTEHSLVVRDNRFENKFIINHGRYKLHVNNAGPVLKWKLCAGMVSCWDIPQEGCCDLLIRVGNYVILIRMNTWLVDFLLQFV